MKKKRLEYSEIFRVRYDSTVSKTFGNHFKTILLTRQMAFLKSNPLQKNREEQIIKKNRDIFFRISIFDLRKF